MTTLLAVFGLSHLLRRLSHRRLTRHAQADRRQRCLTGKGVRG